MEAMIDITQHELNSSLDNEAVDAKIKLRASSHANLIRHLKSVPYKTAKGSKIKSSDFHFPIEEMKINILPHKNMNSVLEAQKPINVKEDKAENIRKHSDILISVAIGEQQLEQEKEISIQPPVVEETNNAYQAIAQDDSVGKINLDTDSTNIDGVVDVSEYITKLNNETQLLKHIREEATLAQQEADISDENVSKLSIEVSELEKQEADAIRRKKELDRKMMEAYENQARTLANKRSEYADIIEEANTRKRANENKIIQFQSRIENIRDHITAVNEDIAKGQEIISGLQQPEFSDGIISFSDVNDNEEKVKRIA